MRGRNSIATAVVTLKAAALASVLMLLGLVTLFLRRPTVLPHASELPLVLLLALGALLLIGYRAFTVLSDRHARLERLYHLSDALAGAPGSADVVRSLLEQSTDLLQADYAEVMLGGVSNGVRLWSQRHGKDMYGPVEAAAHHLTLPFPPSGQWLVRGNSPAEGEFLAARGISQAILVPMKIDGPLAGHLLVADRRGPQHGFSQSDLRLLETVANHGSVALRNGRLIERLHFEARHDELTGLPNRLNFRGLLDEAAEASRHGGSCAVMVLDFNGFKAINDSLGHQAGDELLRVLAGRFHAAMGEDAIVARLGGDEFAVLSRQGTPAAAADLARRLLATFEDPVPVAGTRLRVGGSLGIALGPEHGATGADLLRKADVAMYVAKSASGGWRMYSSDMTIQSPEALTLATDLRDALRAGEIGIVVQPVVDLATGAVHSFEALARWHHPVLGEIAPEQFFTAAERSGQVVTLSQRVLDLALAAARTWLTAGRRTRIAVNLAPGWLADPSLPTQIAAALTRHQLPAELLSLEVTERSVIAEPRRAAEVLTRLHAMGVHLSVDDFGTGYSSLTFLSHLPFDQIKIHQSFVQQVHHTQRGRAVVHSIVDLGRNLGLEVVAEGVADAGTGQLLLEMGCTLAQGYLFTPPVTVEDIGWVDGRLDSLAGCRIPMSPPSR
jgi:diguanylate cyclase (GGDEF)-like protein